MLALICTNQDLAELLTPKYIAPFHRSVPPTKSQQYLNLVPKIIECMKDDVATFAFRCLHIKFRHLQKNQLIGHQIPQILSVPYKNSIQSHRDGSYTSHGIGTGTRAGTIENNGSLSLSLCNVYCIPIR